MKPRLFIRGNERGIREIGFKATGSPPGRGREDSPQAWNRVAEKELRAYFAGRLAEFKSPCDLGGLPPFTQAVLRIAARIPYGEVRSYGWIAARLGKPKASRAVGNALARNPIPILIPCHRVVRSDGSLGGYALGRSWKTKLLALEKAHKERLTSPGPKKTPQVRGFKARF